MLQKLKAAAVALIIAASLIGAPYLFHVAVLADECPAENVEACE